jgi:uncharacterized protein YndB with AHSA1/START domain
MTVTGVHRDPEALTMTITTEFDAPVTRVWKLWENPRELERWWGPPEYPATFVRHDLTPGAFVTYYMTGPDGERPHGWWRVISAEPPHVLEFEDGFADDAGEPNPEMPTMIMRVTIAERPGGGSRMAIETRFPSPEAMEQLLAMGMDEGMTAAIGQIDGLLRAGTAA